MKTKLAYLGLCVVILTAMFRLENFCLAEDLNYPELTVTPRASDRLKIEANIERRTRLQTHLSIQGSALITVVASLIESSNVDRGKDPKAQAPTAGLMIGGGWLAATFALSAFYLPYGSNYNDLRGLPTATVRDQLTRERLAEEALQRAAKLGKVMRWTAGLTNLGASFFLLSKANVNTIAFPVSAVAVVGSLIPIVFSHTWEQVWTQQQDYKKRIYAPVAGPILFQDPVAKNYLPGLGLSFFF